MGKIPVIEVGTDNQIKIVEPILLVALDENGDLIPIRCDSDGAILTSSE